MLHIILGLNGCQSNSPCALCHVKRVKKKINGRFAMSEHDHDLFYTPAERLFYDLQMLFSYAVPI